MRVGVLGGGQLGRMLALAAYPLGMRPRLYDPSPEACAGQVAELITGSFESAAALARFAHELDAVTYEWENVPVAAVRSLAGRLPVFPPVAALETAQDRLAEKECFRAHAIPTAAYMPVGSRRELEQALMAIGAPSVLKTRRLGYDGRGQAMLRSPEEADAAWEAVGGAPSILESYVEFDRELSIVGVRSAKGEVAFYPLVENHHREGILRLCLAPAPRLTAVLQASAEIVCRRLLENLEYVGVLAIELFEKDGRLLANEMAPRVHNSGHWTIEGAATSQFENHLRAIAGFPLGSTAARGVSAMVNLIGALPDTAEALAVPGAHLHLYGKEPRPGRKLGHVTLTAASEEELQSALARVRRLAEYPVGTP
jgi:5-(carboxyamino)imidazole ribonucleotide synthase